MSISLIGILICVWKFLNMEETMNFDDVLGIVGGMGMFQWCIFIVYSVASAWSVESIYSNFVGKYFVLFTLFTSQHPRVNIFVVC